MPTLNDPIYIIGYGTTKCVLSTVIEGFHRGYCSLVVVADATLAKAELTCLSILGVMKKMVNTIDKCILNNSCNKEVCYVRDQNRNYHPC